ncbi:hypothetical protein DERP_011603 [Dermatophagoides pteronyssinus]|uniref:Uncharacterized protein n=1 Tax=Dermatophagoides pteronyssinus TaxID=6956 RepID=A0ABQ8JWD4_DERPT|nr:hypothetical protein DERP_011603 [Dermatophagoides pteronyssinus]
MNESDDNNGAIVARLSPDSTLFFRKQQQQKHQYFSIFDSFSHDDDSDNINSGQPKNSTLRTAQSHNKPEDLWLSTAIVIGGKIKKEENFLFFRNQIKSQTQQQWGIQKEYS